MSDVFLRQDEKRLFYSRIVTPSEIDVTKITHSKSGTKISWNPLNLNCSGISIQYFLNFTNKDLLVHSSKTVNNSFSCGTECINTTSFIIWAVVEKKAWTATFHNLSATGKGESSFKNAFSLFNSRMTCLVTWNRIFCYFSHTISTFETCFFFH